MIVGIGTDICEVQRIRQAIARFGDRFLRRCFTPHEIAYCQSKANSVERFAARFAAKEAAMKAIGTGLSRGVSWQDFNVGRAPGGRPVLELSGRAAQIATGLGTIRTHLSITHVPEQAVAFVILEC
ncbi:MAG TPA: holo-ACP synthase [Terriglobales bacterium]|jgi:holo-[acyl-carrier protein] synthase